MELVKKVCRFCYKDFQSKVKQQRYCSKGCSYKGKNRSAFNNFLGIRRKEDSKSNADSIRVQCLRPDSDMAGLCLDREAYSE